ncbi:MAG: PCMD domain-containing protein [Bacteroidales bacterium]|nr:PCMD domain-containing protein [Bacteroidales bacterium]
MKNLIIYVIALLGVVGCISNDIPYPVVVPHITSLQAEGSESVDIDYANRTVTIHLREDVDLRSVSITSVEIDQQAAEPSMAIVGIHDLTSPVKFNIRMYDDYEWTLVAVREIERYFTVAGQVGSSVIDPVNCRAVATVGSNVSLSNITVTSLKLGPEGLTDYSFHLSQMRDFTNGQTIEVTAFGLTEVWSLFVQVSDVNVDIRSINSWAYKAYVTLSGVAGMDNGLRYRLKGDSEWMEVSEDRITSDGGTFVAEVIGLTPESVYEVQAFCGQESTAIREFVTESADILPNGSFEYASKVAGKDYYKFYDPSCGVEDGSYMFWGSGNGEGSEGVNGSANLGIVITYIDTEEKVDGNQSVRAQTSQMAGMLAAGNLFTGQFAGLVGTSGGKVNFGRPWTSRPTALKLYCRYVTGKMDIIKGSPAGVNLTGDDYDTAEIKFAIGYWDYKKYGGSPSSPVHVNTTNASTFIDYRTDASTIADGNLLIHHDGYVLNGAEKVSVATDEWIEYTIPLNYHDLDMKPTHIIISCAASRYGDYFSGCSRSKLWIDAAELVY